MEGKPVREDLTIMVNEALREGTFGSAIDVIDTADYDKIFDLLRGTFEKLGVRELTLLYEERDPQVIIELLKDRIKYAKLLHELEPKMRHGQGLANIYGMQLQSLQRHMAILEELQARSLQLDMLEDDEVKNICPPAQDSSVAVILANVGRLLSEAKKPLPN